MTLDDTMEDEVKVTIIATGFQEQSKEEILKQPKRDMLGRPMTARREAENFITRGIKKELSREEEDEMAVPQQATEDLETPAFIRRSLNKEAR